VKHAKPVPAEPENAFWRELRQSTALGTVYAALQPFRCCGAPNLCGVPCQDSELSGHLAVAEQLVREELAKQTHGPLCATTYGQTCDDMPGCGEVPF
jgi:hypothetical protein